MQRVRTILFEAVGERGNVDKWLHIDRKDNYQTSKTQVFNLFFCVLTHFSSFFKDIIVSLPAQSIMMEPEEQSIQPAPKEQKGTSKARIFIRVLLVMLVLLLALPFTLYIPQVQDFVCQRVVSWLNSTSDELEYQVGQVRLGFPLKLKVNDVAVLKRKDGTPLVSVGSLKTGLDDIPLNQPYFVVNNLEVRDVVIGMDSLTQSFGMAGQVEQLDIQKIEVDPMNAQLRIARVHLHEPNLSLYLAPSVPDEDEDSQDWFVSVKQVDVHDGHLKYDNSDRCLSHAMQFQPTSPYLDYDHFDLQGVSLAARDILYDTHLIRATVDDLKAKDQNSGLEVTQLATNFEMEDRVIRVSDLDLQLAHGGMLKGEMQTDLALLDSLHNGYLSTSLQCQLDSANLFRLAAPYLPSLVPHWQGSMLSLSLAGRVTGDSLDLRNLELSVDRDITVKAEAFGLDPFDNDKRSVAATLKSELSHADYLVSAFVADPAHRSYRLPDSLSVDLEASQRQQLFSGRVDMRQRDVDVLGAEASYETSLERYHLKANTQRLDISQFVPSIQADGLTAHLNADGRHFRFPSKYTRVEVNMQIDSLCYTQTNGHRDQLQGITAEASLNEGNYVAQLVSTHPYLQLDTHLEGIYLKDTLVMRGHLNVPHADLANLPAGFAQEGFGVLGFRSQFGGHYDWKDESQLALRIDSLRYDDGTKPQYFDSILVTLESEPGMLYADVTGGDAAVSFNTEKTIRELPGILTTMGEEVGRQLDSLRFDFSAIQHTLPQGQLDFHMAQDNPFYPAINYLGYHFQSIDMSAYNLFDLNLDAAIIGLRNDDHTLDFDSIIAEIRPCKYLSHRDSVQELYGYRLSGHALHIDPKARETYDIHASGLMMPDSVALDVRYVDGNYVTRYDAAASLAIGNDTMTLHLEKDPVIFALPFKVNKDNHISLMEYRNAQQHHRTNSSAKVLMTGPNGMTLDVFTRKAKNRDIGNQMLVRLQNLDLGNAANMMKASGSIGGKLNLTATADLFPDSLGGNVRAGIRTFHLGEYKADTLSYDGQIHLAHSRRDVTGRLTIDEIVKMQLKAALADTMNLEATISELPLPLVNLFLPTDINLAGMTSGKVTLRGKDLETARMDAALSLHDASVNISDLDATLHLPTDTLRVINNRMNIHDFNIHGVNQNPLTLRGQIDMRKKLTDPQIDLRIAGQNVQIINNNRLRLKDQYIYGRLPLTADIRVKGTTSNLNVDGKLQVLSGTNLNYYLQDDPLQATSKVDQLVEFVSFRQMDRKLAHATIAPLVAAADEGLTLELKIDIDKDVRVNAFLPGTDNNRVTIVGGGPLVMQSAADGMITMSGVYDVTSGTVDYKLPILPMTKKFNILNSSSVSWTGNAPGAPTISIQASENVRTAVDDAQGSRLVNFVVTINITGTLDALDMSFTCSAPEDGTINSEIESMTEEERSKAALMLLVAQTYLGPGAANEVGLGTANAALNSVLNRQMDQILGSKLKNTDLDLGIDTYSSETGGARTDYSIKVSQRFFNDRFRATIGGRVSSGGDPNMGNGARLGDMSLEWLIKKDGTHYLKFYRRYNYESVFEGEILETGIGYAQERQAYKFKHLLIPTSKSRQARIMEAIRQMQQAEEEAEAQRLESDDDKVTDE